MYSIFMTMQLAFKSKSIIIKDKNKHKKPSVLIIRNSKQGFFSLKNMNLYFQTNLLKRQVGCLIGSI